MGIENTRSINAVTHEIKSFGPVADRETRRLLSTVFEFKEIAEYLRVSQCPLGDVGMYAPACMQPHRDDELGWMTDIWLNDTEFEDDPLDPPGPDLVASDDDVRFNTCNQPIGTPPNSLYETLVHEAGHALGLGFNGSPHSENVESVMSNFRGGANCAPHPFDVMALYALYQAGPRP